MIMAFINLFSLFTLVLLIISYRTIEGIRTHGGGQNGEMELQIKTPIKTFKFDYGTFDCIDIYKQPAFEHPLLKNHKIQLTNEASARPHRFGLSAGCPNGTVPIRRTINKGDESVHHYYPDTKRRPNVHFAVVYITTGKNLSGGKAKLDIHNPECVSGETSGAQIWLFNTHRENVGDGISAGWMVDPQLYGGDAHTFLTTTWVGKDEVGCTNLLCPGFVQVDPTIPLGLLLPSISQFEGTLYKIGVSLSQDKDTLNWWLSVGVEGVNEVKVGYWPKEIFYYLDEGAKTLSYGGVVRGIPDKPTPPMGSGLSDICRYDRTAFMSNLQFTEFGDDTVYDASVKHMDKKADCSNYQAYYPCKQTKDLGFYFMYGGPRSYCN